MVRAPQKTLIALVALGAAGAIGLGVWTRERPPATRQPQAAAQDKPAKEPTLYCNFYNFMHNAMVVSFYFVVNVADASQSRFSEIFVENADGVRTIYGDAGEPLPVWAYVLDEGTPTITSPDGETKIILYGLKPKSPGVLWGEAGVRSNDYKNLGGRCRQAFLGGETGASTQ